MEAFFINGVMRGGAYALAGLGLILIFRTSRVVNFAHGAIATLATFTFIDVRDRAPTVVALVVGIGVAALAGYVIERTTMRPLQERSQAVKLVATVGWLLTIQFGTDLVFDNQSAIVDPIFPSGTVDLFGVRVAYFEIGLVVVMGAIAYGLWFWLNNTDFGTDLRAVSHDRASAQLLGVDANRVTSVAWTVGGALAGLAGILIAPDILVESQAVTVLLFHSFAAALIAGFTSIGVLVLASLALGGVEDLVSYFYTRAGVQDAVMFVLLLAVLLLRSSPAAVDAFASVDASLRRWLTRLGGGASDGPGPDDADPGEPPSGESASGESATDDTASDAEEARA